MLVVAGCENSSVSNSDYDDLARIVAGSLATPSGGGDVGALADSSALARGILPPGGTRDDIGFVHATHFGLTYRYLVTCNDARGARLAQCGDATDSADVLASWGGMLQMPSFTGRIARDGAWTIVAVNSTMAMATGRTWLYESTVKMDSSVIHTASDRRDLMMFVDMATRNLMGGRMQISVELGGADDDARPISVAASFAPDRRAVITLDGTHEYTVDLDSGEIMTR
jgi:hypothetical protein